MKKLLCHSCEGRNPFNNYLYGSRIKSGMTILFLIFSFWFLVFPKGAFAQAATLSLDPANGTFNQGCSFPVNVVLDTGGAQTDGTDAILIYDTSRLTATSISNGAIYSDYPGNNIDAAAGKITISGLASLSTPFTGKGTLATVNFTVPAAAATGATLVKFDFNPNNKTETRDSNVVQRETIAEMLNSVLDGNYTIGTGICSTQTLSSPAPTKAPVVYPIGGPVVATPSATPTPTPVYAPINTLPDGGTKELTFALTIVGSVLTVLGILGLALL